MLENSPMLFYALFCVSIIALAVMYSAIFERRFEETAALAVFTEIGVLYAVGYIDKLSIAAIVLLVAVAVGFLVCVCIALGRGRGKTLALNTFTLGFFVFLILAVVIYYATEGMTIEGADNNVTIQNIKLMLENESFTKVVTSSVDKLGYQPGYALFCWVFTVLQGEFNDVSIIRAANIFAVTMIIPLLSRIQWKSIFVGLFTIVTMFLTPWLVVSNMQFFNIVNVDSAIALMFGFMLFVYFCHEQCGYVYFSLGLASAVLCIMKPGAELLAIFMLLLVLVDIAGCGYRDMAELLAKPGKWLSVVLYPLIGLGGFISWWKFAGEHGIRRLFECIFITEARQEGFAGIFTGVFEFFKSQGTDGSAEITYLGWLFVLAIFGAAAAALGLDKWDRIRTGVKAFVVLIGSVLFLFVIAFGYTYIYPTDAETAGSLITYLTIYLAASIFMIFNLFLGKVMDRFYTFGRLAALALFIFVIIFTPAKVAYESTVGKVIAVQEEYSPICHIEVTKGTQIINNI